MYWPRSGKSVNIDSLEEILRDTREAGDTFERVNRLGRTVEEEEEEEEEEITDEEEEEAEGRSNLKRSKSISNQLKKKLSTPNIQDLIL